ncbi:MAG TPA: thiamine pyrophosphate-dependent enzyme, partial [Bacillales bacterium]|nr:thiamine pyrophosphate-dependent enzyme [Bacillales bacterium]
EIDLTAYFAHTCKWTVEIHDVERIPELLHRAFHTARSGRPGPVVVALPHDMLEDSADEDVDLWQKNIGNVNTVQPNEESVNQAAEMIDRSKRPVVIAGGGIIRSGATPLLETFVEQRQLPVVTAFRRYDAFPNDHHCYAGWLGFGPDPQLLNYIQNADLVIALGTRFSQVTTQNYQLLQPGAQLIHVDLSSDIFGKVYSPALPIQADVKVFLEKMTEQEPKSVTDRDIMVEKLHEAYLAFSDPKQRYSDQVVDLDGMMFDFVRHAPKDTIITSDAGNFFGWLARYYRFKKPGTYIGPTSGAMGYGLPAAVGAKIAWPGRQVISFSGDGGFMMTLQELDTSIRYNAPIVAIVVNNNL